MKAFGCHFKLTNQVWIAAFDDLQMNRLTGYHQMRLKPLEAKILGQWGRPGWLIDNLFDIITRHTCQQNIINSDLEIDSNFYS